LVQEKIGVLRPSRLDGASFRAQATGRGVNIVNRAFRVLRQPADSCRGLRLEASRGKERPRTNSNCGRIPSARSVERPDAGVVGPGEGRD